MANTDTLYPRLRSTHIMPPRLSHGSLFSGIGGFDLAAQWMGWNNVFQCEKDEWCRKVLAKNFPNSKRYGDIKEFNAKKYYGTIDVISGGFPCQPFSVAGQRKGEGDDRYLWAEMLRVIATINPTYVVGENVTGIVGMALDTVLSDLENSGYTTETFILPACGKNAWHRRDRVYVVAYANSIRRQHEQKESRKPLCNQEWNNTTEEQGGGQQQCRIIKSSSVLPYTDCSRKLQSQKVGDQVWEWTSDSSEERATTYADGIGRENGIYGKKQRGQTNELRNSYQEQYGNYWETESRVGRVVDGIPNRVDRLRGLGNAIVPQIAYEIFSAIGEIHSSRVQ